MLERDTAFTAFVASERLRLFRLAYLLCGSPDQAEDIVQHALISLYRSWRRVARAGNVLAYARRAVINSHVDQTRRPWRRERVGVELVDRPAPTGLSVEDSTELWTALRALPPKQRRVVLLRHYWGLSVEETAADLGVRPGTVKSQTSDALRALRSVLGQPKERDDDAGHRSRTDLDDGSAAALRARA